MSFVAAASIPAANNTSITGSIPAGTLAGHCLVAFLSIAGPGTNNTQPAPSTPVGWQKLKTQDNQSTTNGVIGVWYYRWATGSDSAPTITLHASQIFKTALVIAAYDGGAGVGAPTIVTGNGATGAQTLTNTSDTVNVPAGPASDVLETFAQKSSTNATYKTNGGTIRSSVFGSAGGAADALLVDAGGPVSGTQGGHTATADTTGAFQVHGTLIIPPAISATVTAPVAKATAAAPAPTFTSSPTVTAPAAKANATAPAPTVGAQAQAATPPATAAASAPAPTVSASVVIAAPATLAGAVAPSPDIVGGADVAVLIPSASATATAPAPAISSAVEVLAVVATSSAAAGVPDIAAGTGVQPPAARAYASSPAPAVGPVIRRPSHGITARPAAGITRRP